MAKTSLDELIDTFVPDNCGMRPNAPWDSLFLIDREYWTFETFIGWHFGCYFAGAEPTSPTAEDTDP